MCNLKFKISFARIAFPLAALALVVGHFAPWAQPAAAALTLSAHELAVFTNYTPNAGVFFNEGYLLPLWAAALLIAAAANRRALPLAAAVLLVVLSLPGYPELRKLMIGQGSEFVLQGVVAAFVLLVCAALGLLNSDRALRIAAAAAAAAALIAAGGFVVVRAAAIEPLFGVPVGLGWGWWCTLAAGMMCGAGAFLPRR
ncbi:MAG: hypothetical protein NTZ50_06965 [Chloroflexi bacterium]|nr:hypothetical protein [Chloroflexota bacterium]